MFKLPNGFGYTYDAPNWACYNCGNTEYWDNILGACTPCPDNSNCCSYNQFGILTFCGCNSGYTLDQANNICYQNCRSAQYYNPSILTCMDCPSGANCCSLNNGQLKICGCVSGQSLDVVNDICYTNCLSNQYYDSSFQQCVECAPWSSPCDISINGLTTTGCCCNSGFSEDPDTGLCIKSCRRNQYYNYETGSCISCGTGVASCLNGVYVCQRSYTLDEDRNICYRCNGNAQYYNFDTGSCADCPSGSNCCTYLNGIVTVCGCQSGYTLDEINGYCFNCGSTQYYDYSAVACRDCPQWATCCTYDNGQLTLCGCRQGYTADFINNICYKSCTSAQYYDISITECVNCPGQATCCRLDDLGILVICGCPSGYEIDLINTICYRSCTSAQYYDPLEQSCMSCGVGVSCCTYNYDTSLFEICGCSRGYTYDALNNLCYSNCATLQYYDYSLTQCISCPEFSTCCTSDINTGLQICGCRSGYSIDTINGLCYKCATFQYYDAFNQECLACPGQATCCRVNEQGVLTICACPRGYTLDEVNQICYEQCNQGEYYDTSQLACTRCPGDATCCTLQGGVVQICGCSGNLLVDSYNNLCYEPCPVNTYYDVFVFACLTCQQNSFICSSTFNGIEIWSCCCQRGYKIDSTATFCQKDCTIGQYYDSINNDCINCPANAYSCDQNGQILSCLDRYTLDEFANICYRCNSGQSYDPFTFSCVSCPDNVSCCYITAGVLDDICGCNSGYTLDYQNLICYRCANNEYWNPNSASCISCPSCATSCSLQDGLVVVTGLRSGQSWDDFSQSCYTCSITQYYNYDIAQCGNCPSCARRCTYAGGGAISVTSIVNGFDWNDQTQTCVKSCSTTTYYSALTRCKCRGYTYDSVNQLCYKCSTNQYYDDSFGNCLDCPANSNCCGITNGIFSVCGCQSGYTLDSSANVCYLCSQGTYWDSQFQECLTCPGDANCCTYNNGIISICGCPRGYSIDSLNGICYQSCSNGEYYNYNILSCTPCPAGATCCTFENNVIRICGCPAGQSIDQVNQICYNDCGVNQYYSSEFLSCMNCLAWASVCQQTINGVSTTGCCCNQGFSLDETGTYCQRDCSRAQYFDQDSGSCISCPRYARTCNEFGILTCLNRYTLDSINNVCYSCTSLQYYDFTLAQCQSCPTGSNCCTYENGFVSICGCRSGYTLDEYNGVCYQCSTGQYWDTFGFNGPQCVNCPLNSNCCGLDDNGFLSICGCISGYTIDSFNQVCYRCSSSEYYDQFQGTCNPCPDGSNCCTYTDGFFQICGCASGYTLDSINQVCYQCTSTQYYNQALGACSSCPDCAVRCFVRNGVLAVTRTRRGTSYDAENQYCYDSCQANQYYDSFTLSCQSCPFCASSCTYNSDRAEFTVRNTISGYNWNQTSQSCYCNAGQYLYYDPFSFKKTKLHHSSSPHHLQLSYAGQVGQPSTFESQLGSTTESQQTDHDVYLYESITTLNPGSYADKYTLYPWTYTIEEGSYRHFQSDSLLDVTAHTMYGINQDYCGYFNQISQSISVEPNTHMPTLIEAQQHPCGHYVVFAADTEGEAVTFRHLTTDAIQTTVVSTIMIITFWMLNY